MKTSKVLKVAIPAVEIGAFVLCPPLMIVESVINYNRTIKNSILDGFGEENLDEEIGDIDVDFSDYIMSAMVSLSARVGTHGKDTIDALELVKDK